MPTLPPLPRCKTRKSGAHSVAVVLPEDSEHDMTLFCERCFAVLRLPVSGALGGSLDAWAPEDIEALLLPRASLIHERRTQ